MNMRISKYPPTFGVGVDKHGKLPGYGPPAPPAPPAPLVPSAPWAVVIAAPWSAALTGKWSLVSVQTEGMGDILWGYDWGPGQVHVPITPHYLSPSIIILALGSTTKYFLPSFAVQEKIDGGALGGSGAAPVAVSYASYFIPTQQCHDVSAAVSFVFPSSVSFQAVSTRWVGFNGGDLAAGLLGMAGDALAAAIFSKCGGALIPGNLDEALLGGLASTFMGQGVNVINYFPDAAKLVPLGIGVVGLGGGGLLSAFGLVAAGEVVMATGGAALAPVLGWGIGLCATDLGNAWGSDQDDWGYTEPPPDSSSGSPPSGSGGPSDAGSDTPAGSDGPADAGTDGPADAGTTGAGGC